MNHCRNINYPPRRFSRMAQAVACVVPDPFCSVYFAKVKTKDSSNCFWHCEREKQLCVFALIIISIHPQCIAPVCFIPIWFYPPHQRCWAEGMISMIKSLSGTYTAMSAPHLNTKTPRPACCKSPDPFPPLPLLACSSKLCISAVGGKHYTGLA